jgi:protein-S-isoprenylcysteine O-methyltransferase Ste14
MSALQLTFAAVLGAAILLVSWRSLSRPGSHGFWRFWGFSFTLYLLVTALPVWVTGPGAIRQIISFALLFLSLFYVLYGVWLLRRHGGRTEREESPETLGFENTARLVTAGLYRYIRHPMYGSLILLSWGCSLKLLTIGGAIAVVAATVFYFVTAKIEEGECRQVFGEEYRAYLQQTRMFIPFLF